MAMKEITELDVYRLAEQLSDLIWNDYDKWSPKVQRTILGPRLNAFIRTARLSRIPS
jgi:hypothetical protein